MLYQVELELDASPGISIEEVPNGGKLSQRLDQQVIEHHLSYNVMHDTSGPASIRIKAQIRGLDVQALIDGGSSDSFIQPRIAKFLNLPIDPAPGVRVMVGNFAIMDVEGRIPSLEVTLQVCKITIPEVFVLHVAGGDLVIGTPWLRTLRAHIVDYDAAFLRFWHEGQFVTVQGETSSALSQAQFHHIGRLVNTDAIAEAFTVQLQQSDERAETLLQLPEGLNLELTILLHTCGTVFAQPKGLPPQRAHDHLFPLTKGAEPVKVRPYRYPHSQKNQIELMVKQMLEDRII
nr:uncharacterized protein LOC112716183 isoform X1 [Arachis hypogaea]